MLCVDGHHKLVRWRFVTHCGIDGYSRLIVFLHCSTNNRAATVLNHFIGAVQQYGLPNRVRTDQGRENIKVAQYMLEHRGTDRRSVLVGSSVHNQRIERLWRDMHRCVTLLYYRLFYYLENGGLLDPLSDVHLSALHYVYLERINRSLQIFMEGWNHHKVCTEGYSPHQLFARGVITQSNRTLDIVNGDYGIDNESPVPEEDGEIVIPETRVDLSSGGQARLQQIDPLQESSNYGINLYQAAVEIISEDLQSHSLNQ